MKRIDLHTHSNCSDGSMTPTELIRYAKSKGLSAVALTDHDSVSGVREAQEEGSRQDIEIVPGIELSARSETETHILGYYIDIDSPILSLALKEIRSVRDERTENTARKLRELGFDITVEETKALAPSGLIGRAHFAKLMVQKGYISSVREGFDKYLANGKYAYDGTQYLTSHDAVKLISDCGGVSFVAHPHLIRLSDEKLIAFLTDLREYGLSGIEGYYNEYTPEMQEHFQSMAASLGLLISGGTDFHAAMKPHIDIGTGQGNMCIPYSVLEKIKERVSEIRKDRD